ncbi:MAG: DUF167 domain-containing protein [Nanoarchaeota archaeon]|nr:DUF167 domain-containing protein [Nanoarchaeota archaeon]
MNNKSPPNYFPNFLKDSVIGIKAKPNSSKSILEWDLKNNRVNAFLHSIPDDGKANDELIKLFKRQLKLKVELVSGFKSRDKKLRVL